MVAAKYNLHYLNDFLKSERQLEWQDNQWNGHLHSALSAPPSSLQCTATGRCLQMRGRTLTRRVEKNHMIFQGFSDCRDIFHLYNMREKTYIANQFLRMCLSDGCLDRSFTALNKSSAAMQQIQQSF